MKKSPFRIVVIITLIIVAIIIALVVLANRTPESTLGRTFDETPSIEGQPTLGDADAPVTIVEFGDFKCPACKVWGEDILPQLEKDYIDNGKVQFAYINVLFHGEESRLASLAAESVYQQHPETYWEFHKALFDEQPSENHDSQWVTEEKTREIAEGMETIDTDELTKAIENKTLMNEVDKDESLVSDFEVEMTPSIMVDNVMIEDPFDYEAIEQAINEALGE
ncbi:MULTISPECIES: DsbA family protein [Oceanobacillus]|uniref:DsbA family protein n=1 Tax=Oceanobacillus TaxID=182709 RepID=UPI0005963459|nr:MULTISPECIES: thioredoxin domain-containing protein [Oceanobacillus]